MTQPIQEPTTDRALQGFAYARDQIFRRPAPTAAGTSWPWIALLNVGQTLATGSTLIPSYMTELVWDPALVTDPQLGSDTIFDVETTSHSGTDYFRYINRVEGWFLHEMIHHIEQGSADGTTDYFQHRITADPQTCFFPEDNHMGIVGTWGSSGTTPIEIFGHIETVRLVWLPLSQVIMEPKISQIAGADKGVNGHLKVWYLGGLGGSTNDADWESASA